MDNLLAAILLLSIESQRRRGLERDYQPVEEQGWRIKGRVDMERTMRLQVSGRPEAVYTYDRHTKDTLCNRILKTSALALSSNDKVSGDRRRRLHGALACLQKVSPIADPVRIPWGSLRYHRNNRSYQMLMGVCYLVIQHRLMGERKGATSPYSMTDKPSARSSSGSCSATTKGISPSSGLGGRERSNQGTRCPRSCPPCTRMWC